MIRTKEPELSPVVAATAYKQLNDDRVRAHLFVVALAFLPDRALEKGLRAGESGLSSQPAWQTLETAGCLEVDEGGWLKAASVSS